MYLTILIYFLHYNSMQVIEILTREPLVTRGYMYRKTIIDKSA